MELSSTHKALGLLTLGAIACLGASIGNLDPTYETRSGPIPTWLVESGQATVRADSRVSPGLAPVKLLLSLTGVGCFAGAIALARRATREDYEAWEESLYESERRGTVRVYEAEAWESVAPEIALQRATERFSEALGLPAAIALEAPLQPLQATPEPVPVAEPLPEPIALPIPAQPAPEVRRQEPATLKEETPVPEAIAPDTNPNEFADIAQILASYDGHLMIASRTGAGKTSTLLAAMEAMLSIYGGQAVIRIVDPKQSGWAGLEADEKAVRYPDLADPEGGAFDLLESLQEATAELSRRSKARRKARSEGKKWSPPPYYLILDEQISLMGLAEEWDLDGNKGAKVYPRAKRLLDKLLLMGREDRVRLWICGQSHLCQDAGFNGAKRDSFGVIAQGRDGDFRSIERAIGDQYLIPSKAERDRLQRELGELKAIAGKRPIIFSAIKGYRLGLLPDLEGIKDRRFLEPKKQDISPEQAIAKLEAELAAIRAQISNR